MPSITLRLMLPLALAAGLFPAAGLIEAQAPPTSTAAAAAPARPAGSVGDLLVAPTRIVVEGNRRSAEVAVVNTGADTATYRISLIHLRMLENGSVEEFTDAKPEDRVADPLVRYSPRQVVLEPGVAQTVRIQLRKPAELEAGEYRSHLLFRALPKVETPGEGEATPEGLQIRLIPVFGVSIPLIVRHGQTGATARLDSLQLVPGSGAADPLVLKAWIRRQGNRSVYGNLRVWSVKGGREKLLAVRNGVAVYSSLSSRSIEIAVQPEDGTKLNGSRLRVTYSDAETTDEGGALLAEAHLDVP